jgi:hypothetical protein
VVAGSKLNKVLIDGGSGLNVLFTKTLKKMKVDITHMLTKSTSPFEDPERPGGRWMTAP